MEKLIKRFFENEKIEYFAALPYDALQVKRPYLTERKKITPKSAVLFLVPYYYEGGVNISSYAVARDYHIYISDVTERLSRALSFAYPKYKFIGFGDHSPIDERRAALMAGLGILGENGLIINEKYGSYVFVAELLTDAPPEIVGAIKPLEVMKCEGCGACLNACPTGRLSGEGECLSDITQKKGELSSDEKELISRYNTAWGCDVCQRVCPHNSSPVKTPIAYFKKELIPSLTADDIISMDEESFYRRAYSWRGKNTILRNLSLLKDK